MLENIRLKTKILIGFSLLALLLLVVGLTGVRGMHSLSGSLSHILGPVWSTADGAMETAIEIEAGMLLIHSILLGTDFEKAKQELAEIQANAESSSARMVSAGLLPEDQMQAFQTLNQHYISHIDALFKEFQSYVKVRDDFQGNVTQLVALGEIIEEVGDSAVEEIEESPDAPFYWNYGLKERWMAADGGMESNIGLLWQLYYLQQLLTSDDVDALQQKITKAIDFQTEASTDMFASGRFNDSAGPDYDNQSYEDAYKQLFANHTQMIQSVINSYARYKTSLITYQKTADSLLELLRVIESQADSSVSLTMQATEKNQSQSETTMNVTLVLGLLMSVIFAWMLKTQIMGSLTLFQSRIDEVLKGDGDLSRRLNLNRKDEFGDLSRSFDQFVEKIHGLVADVARSAPRIRQSTKELLGAAQKTSDGVEGQRDQIDHISNAINQMDANAHHVSDSIGSASRRAADVDQETGQVRTVLTQTTQAIEKLGVQITENASVITSLNESVGQINSVLEVITGIAEQTNLLALNAAIEAARAGEQGRGFAVVADEVRSLAARTQDSTGEIRRMIEDLRGKASQAVSSMDASLSISGETSARANEAMNTLNRISELVRDLSHMNQEVSKAALEQSETTRMLAQNIESIKEIAESTSSQMLQTLTSGRELDTVGDLLQKQVKEFRV